MTFQEAHVYKGEVVLGPPPATLRYDDDDDNEPPSSRKSAVASKSRSDDGSNASISNDAASGDATPSLRERAHKVDDGGPRGTDSPAPNARKMETTRGSPIKQSSAASRDANIGMSSMEQKRQRRSAAPETQPLAASAGSLRSKKLEPVAHRDDSDEDDDGDVQLDVAQLERQLQRAKAQAGGKAAPATTTNAKLSSMVKTELQRELEELHGEKGAAKAARWSARKTVEK